MSTIFLNLCLEAVESKLDKLTLYEPVDVKVLNKLINSDLLRVEFHNPLAKGYENEKSQLICYKKLIKKGKAEIKYSKAKNILLDNNEHSIIIDMMSDNKIIYKDNQKNLKENIFEEKMNQINEDENEVLSSKSD